MCWCRLICSSLSQTWPLLACMNLKVISCWNIICFNLGLLLRFVFSLWIFLIQYFCPLFFVFDLIENNVENINTKAYAYPIQGSVITIQVYHCWLWYVWLVLLLDYFPISETDSDSYQSLQNQILTPVWFSKNYSSDIIILRESYFFDCQLLYLLSNRRLWGNCFQN